jgi:hypothetical protein
MRHKNQKPPICIGGSEKLRALDRPRYMNVPSPAPCHVNVAGVGKQSVWGLRIIARTQLSLWHESASSSIPKTCWTGNARECQSRLLVTVEKSDFRLGIAWSRLNDECGTNRLDLSVGALLIEEKSLPATDDR